MRRETHKIGVINNNNDLVTRVKISLEVPMEIDIIVIPPYKIQKCVCMLLLSHLVDVFLRPSII